jgi:signal transduction histidine kinase
VDSSFDGIESSFWGACPDGFCVFDAVFSCLAINRATLKALGLTHPAAAAVGRSLCDLAPFLYEALLPRIRGVLRTGKPAFLSDVPLSRSPDRFARVAILKVRDGFGLALSDATAARLKRTELESSLARLKELTRHDQILREEEMRRTARNFHDEMAPLLTALKIDLYWILNRIREAGAALSPVETKITEIEGVIDESIKTVRKICCEMRPALLEELGLQAAMEWQIQENGKRHPIVCQMSFNCNGTPLSPELSLCLFRVFQEGISNVIRHAAATRAWVTVNHVPSRNAIQLKIRDNGRGIRAEDIVNLKSFGLIGIRERLESFNGRLKVNGRPGKGTTLTAVLPVGKRRLA